MSNIVSPSILSCDFLNIQNDLAPFEGVQDLWVHLDIMDGHFVPNLTFGIPIVKLITQKIPLPMDAHLMVTNPEFHMDEMKAFGLHNITFHVEAVKDSIGLIKKFRNFYKSIGVSIKPGTNPEDLSQELLNEIDLILVMSVEPGFGGQSFMPNSIDKIKWLDDYRKKNKLDFQIQVDGGVSDKNSKILREAGADNLVAGSYVFNNSPEHYIRQVESLR